MHVNGAIKANFSYKPGTYWIYKDSLSGTLDSTYIKENIVQNVDGGTELIEHINMEIFYYDYLDSSTLSGLYTLYQNHIGTYLGNVDYPFVPGNIEGGGTLLDIYNDYHTNGQTYKDVAVVSHLIQSGAHLLIDTFYINTSAGIIKSITYEKTDTMKINRVWKLQRYNIIK